MKINYNDKEKNKNCLHNRTAWADGDMMLKQLMLEGMDIARLNFSHGDHEGTADRERIKDSVN